MHRVVGLQNRINQLSTQFAAKTEKKTKRHPVLYAVAGFLIAFALITSTPLKAITYPITIPFFSAGGMELQVMVWNIVNLVLSAIIGAVLYGVISKSADKGRERKNATIDQSNAQVEANGTVKNLAHFSDSLISPPSGAATPPAESRPDSASSPTRSRPRT